jgi:hypothetical protein
MDGVIGGGLAWRRKNRLILGVYQMRYSHAVPPNKQFQPTNSRCARICG